MKIIDISGYVSKKAEESTKGNVICFFSKVKERREKVEAESRKRSIDRLLRRADKLRF